MEQEIRENHKLVEEAKEIVLSLGNLRSESVVESEDTYEQFLCEQE